MTKGIHVMHSEAERKAISIGPRTTNINGNPRAAYYLTKKELRDLFTRNGFNTNGVAWLKMIIGWKNTWAELAPTEAKILDKDEDWKIVFLHPDYADYRTLQMYGEDNNVPILAVSEE